MSPPPAMFKDIVKSIVTLPFDIVEGTIEGVAEGAKEVFDRLDGKK